MASLGAYELVLPLWRCNMRTKAGFVVYLMGVSVTLILLWRDWVNAATCATNICNAIQCFRETSTCYYDTLGDCDNCASTVRNCTYTGIDASHCKPNPSGAKYDEYTVSSCQQVCPIPPGGVSGEYSMCPTTGTLFASGLRQNTCQ